MNQGDSDLPEVGQVVWPNKEIAEVSLLVPACQVAQRVTVADSHRVTVGQMLRGLIHKYLAQRATESKRQESEVLTQ